MEELIQQLRAAGFSDDEIQKYLESQEAGSRPQPPLVALVRALTDKDGHGPLDAAGGALEGATLGLSKHVVPGLKEQQKDFAARHPGPARASNLFGALATAPLLPFKAGLLARGAVGGGAAAVASAANKEGTLAERMSDVPRDAAVGAGLGMFLPPALSKVARTGQRLVGPYRSAAHHVAEGAGPLLPPNAQQIMARQEALAPGTATPVSISPGMGKSTGIIGADAALAREAAEASAGRVQKLQAALDNVSPKYQQLLGNKTGPLDIGTVDITPVLVKNGMLPTGKTIPMIEVQSLRNTLRGKIETLKAAVGKGRSGGPQMNTLKEQKRKLTEWLEAQEPKIKQLDDDWGFLSRARRSEENVGKRVATARESFGAHRVAGTEPGSPTGNLPGKESFLMRLFGPDRAQRAAEANRLLLQPGQIPEELLEARRRAAQAYQPGLFGPFVVGGQSPAAMGLFE